MTASVKGSAGQITLLDDGTHGDAAPNDGIYGGTTEKLSPAEYVIEAKAVSGPATRTVTTPLLISAN